MIFENHNIFLAEITKMQQPYKLMAMDVGTKKIGAAVRTSNIDVVTPYRTWYRQTLKKDLAVLQQALEVEGVHGLILGLPLAQSGEANIQTKYVIEFGKALSGRTTVPLTFYDERYTTGLANTLLKSANLRRKKRNEVDDKFSACIILEGFAKLNGIT